jgi:hypothetical protein
LRNGRSKGAVKSGDQLCEPFLNIGLGDLLRSKQRTVPDVNDTFIHPQQLIEPSEEIREHEQEKSSLRHYVLGKLPKKVLASQ